MESVTVLIAVYNAEKTIIDTIQSILDQTYQNFKIAIVNDSSTDRTIELIENLNSEKIEITHLKTRSVIGGVNTLMASCQSKYIARIDHDDLMCPDRLEVQVKFMDKNPEIAASGSYIEIFGDYKKIWTRFRANERQLRQNFFWFNSMMHPSMIVRNSVLKEHGIKYNREYAFMDGDNDYPLTEDYKFCYDLSRVGRLTNIPKVLTKYRKHVLQVSIAKKNVQDYVANRIRREGIIDFLNDNGMPITEINDQTDKLKLIKSVDKLKVVEKDKWHRAMTNYMLIQSSTELKFWRFLKILFTTRFIIDRNSAELILKMIYTKFGNEKPMI